MSKKNICVVGGGSWGKNHIRTLKRLGVLSAIVDENQKLLDYYKKEYSDIDTFKNIIYEKIKKLYEKKFPYNHFLYQEIED